VRLDDPELLRAFVVDYVLPGVPESVTAIANTASGGDSA
jgi:hypothetical protein